MKETIMDIQKSANEIDGKLKRGDFADLEELVGIDPITGEFDINLVPESIRQDVIDMGKSMIGSNKKKNIRKKKPRVKTKKTFGQNKKKRKK